MVDDPDDLVLVAARLARIVLGPAATSTTATRRRTLQASD
jgi:hypothetical protein